MAGTQPVLGGYTLPHPAEPGGYRERIEYRGGSREMADGTVRHQLVQTSEKRRFWLRWTGLTSSERTALLNAYAAIKSGSASFTAPDGSTYTVKRTTNDAGLEFEYYLVESGSAFRYRTNTIELVEQ